MIYRPHAEPSPIETVFVPFCRFCGRASNNGALHGWCARVIEARGRFNAATHARAGARLAKRYAVEP